MTLTTQPSPYPYPYSHPNQAATALAAPPLTRRRLAKAQAGVPRAVRPALPQRRSTARAALRARAGASLQLRGKRAAQASRKPHRAASRRRRLPRLRLAYATPCATPYATLYASLYASPRHTPPDACNPRTQGAHQATLVRAPRRAARRVCRAPHAQGAETVHCRLARAPLARGRRRAAVRPQRLGATGSALAAGDARSNARPRTQVQLRGGALPRPVGRLRPAAVGRGRQPHVPCGHMTVDPRARSEMGDAAYCSNLIRWGASSSQEKRTCKNIKKRFEVKLNQNRARAAGDF